MIVTIETGQIGFTAKRCEVAAVQKEKLIRDYTVGSIPRQLFTFMLPFMLSNALQVMYSVVDMIIVGQYVGSTGLAAVSQGSVIINLLTMLCLGFSTAGQTIISQLIGAGRREELGRVIGTLFAAVFLLCVVVTTPVLLGRRVLMSWMNLTGEARELTLQYLVICGFGMVFTSAYNSISSILRGMGDSRHPFLFIALASVLNLIFDIVLTGWLDMGVVGAAIATVFGQAVSVVASLLFLKRHQREFGFDFRLSGFRLDKDYFRQIAKMGIPFSLQTCSVNISMVFVNSFVNQVGVTATATFGVGLKLDDICNKLTMGVQYAAAPMVGQNMGAGKHERVKSVVYWTWILCGIVAALFVACYLLFGREMFALFTNDDAVLELSSVFIQGILWSFPAMAIMRGTNALLQGTGGSLWLMSFAFIDATLRISLSYLIGIVGGMGFFGYVFGYGLSALGIAVPGSIYFFSGVWKKKKLAIARK